MVRFKGNRNQWNLDSFRLHPKGTAVRPAALTLTGIATLCSCRKGTNKGLDETAILREKSPCTSLRFHQFSVSSFTTRIPPSS